MSADGAMVQVKNGEWREEMIDYPHFRQQGIPIGSGIVESGNNVVMQRRMKLAGMRWAGGNLNPMLALRVAIWSEIETHFLANKHHPLAQESDTSQTQSVSDSDVENLQKLALRFRKKRPWQNHRWIYPHRQPLLHRN
jgi:hypothetical protein